VEGVVLLRPEHARHGLTDRGEHPLRQNRQRNGVRNVDWFHMANGDVISMPDKWEYPWYAAWDLAFHCVAMAPADLAFAKQQMTLMLSERYLHPNGQIPAYEWEFGDVNPPVHAWATLYLYNVEKSARGRGDIDFLARSFPKLLLNFTWWVNRTDPRGANVFAGGFLGLDNIGVFDRSAPLPTGGFLEQADGTAWMALYCLNMLEMALELARLNRAAEDMAIKFAEHFLWIALAMKQQGMWDEADGFFYDVLRTPDGRAEKLKVRSFVGLVPFCAVTVLEAETVERFPEIADRVARFLGRNPEMSGTIHPLERPGVNGRRLISILDETALRRVLARLLDPEEFFGDYGIRSLSRYHRSRPFVFTHDGVSHRVDYEPADSRTHTFGGNSNWRGPIWAPINTLIIRTLLQLHAYWGDDFQVACPTGSGQMHNLFEVAAEIARRIAGVFVRDPETGRRAVFGGAEKLQNDPHFRDHILFYEYFHGDNGAGIGASHQTGWTGLVALLLQLFAELSDESVLHHGRLTAASHTRETPQAP
ncbi:MAG: glucosidase, partial [Myxococcota bacterium]